MGRPANIWLTFTRGPNSFYVPLEGDYLCAGELRFQRAALLVRSLCLSSNPYFREGDQLELRKNEDKLVGTLKSESKEIFKGDAGAPKPDEVRYQFESD